MKMWHTVCEDASVRPRRLGRIVDSDPVFYCSLYSHLDERAAKVKDM